MLRKSLNSFLNNINNRLYASSLCFLQIKHNYASFTPRDILHETSDEVGTLTTRFAKHIAMERAKLPILLPTTIRYADYFPISDTNMFNNLLEETPINQIASVVIFASTYRPNADPKKFADVLNAIDKVLMANVSKMDTDVILHTLYALLFLMPNWITRLDFYVAAMKELCVNKLEAIEKTKENFIQVCFYLGLNKKTPSLRAPSSKLNHSKLLKEILENNLDKHLNQMITLDIAMISNAIYKTSTEINVSESYKNRLIEEVLRLGVKNGEDAILVTLLKAMRFLKIHSESVCEHLTKLCSIDNGDNVKILKPQGVAHIFAYYAENLWNCEDDVKPLIRRFLQNVQLEQKLWQASNIRAKDIATFLWCCVQLNCCITTAECQMVENIIKRKIENGQEFQDFPEQLVDCCLYLWLLGHKSKELLQSACSIKKMGSDKSQQSKVKVGSRLPMLLSTVQITEPTMYAEISKYTNNFKAFEFYSKPPDYLLSSKNFNYNDLFVNLSKENVLSSMKLLCPINGINIPSIYGTLISNEMPVFLEVLLPTYSLKFNNEPVAVLRWKIYLLEALNYKVVLIKLEDLADIDKVKRLLGSNDLEEKKVNCNKL